MTQFVTVDRATLEQLVAALEKHHKQETRYSDNKRRANAICAHFTINPLQELAEQAYMLTHGKETIEALSAGRAALAQQELPQKERPDFMVGYDAGMADAKRMAQLWEPVYQYQMADGSWIDQIKDSYDYNRKYVHNATIRVVYTATPAPQAQEPACPEYGASPLYECVDCSYTNYPKKQDMKPQAQDKSNNYLNGYCTGRTDLLKEQAAPQAQGEPTGCACRWDEDDNRVATCARHQGWLDVVNEWAERAKAAEAALQSAQPVAQPLTDKRISWLWSESHNDTTDRMAFQVFARAIEAAHGITEKARGE